jgi:hypothetical protein
MAHLLPSGPFDADAGRQLLATARAARRRRARSKIAGYLAGEEQFYADGPSM